MKSVIILEGEQNQCRRLADRLQDMIQDGESEFEDVTMDYMKEEGYQDTSSTLCEYCGRTKERHNIDEIADRIKRCNTFTNSALNSQVTPSENAERTLEENKTKKPLVSPDTHSHIKKEIDKDYDN